MQNDLNVILTQRLPNKLFVAGGATYDKVWIRDNVYIALALEEAEMYSDAAAVYRGLLSFIKRYAGVLDLTIYPQTHGELIHPRYTIDGELVGDTWGNRQYDAVGCLLFAVGNMHRRDAGFLSMEDKIMIQKMVRYLERCRYWEDADDGMWEDQPTLHVSSIAASIKGIEAVSDFCKYDEALMGKARESMLRILPAESELHPVDMAQLSLLWPYGYKMPEIAEQVERELLRPRGVIRFIGDVYESDDAGEPQWVMGIPWLGLAWFQLGDVTKAREYLAKTEELYIDGILPESFLANSQMCVHTPLAWSHAMAFALRHKLHTCELTHKP